MSSRAVTLGRVLPPAVVFLIADGAFSFLPSLRSEPSSYFFGLAAPLLALAVCGWKAWTTRNPTRNLWWLYTAGLAIWNVGMMLSAREDLLQHFPFEIASLADFNYFFYGIPILFALSTPAEGRRSSLFTWLDGVQALFAGYLTYIAIFDRLPFTTSSGAPISIGLLVLTYNLENVALAIGSILRLLATKKGGEERHFFATLCAFLVSYGIGVGIYNKMALDAADHMAPNVLTDAPFVLLAYLILTLPPDGKKSQSLTPAKTRAALFIDLSSPVFFTAALLTLGLMVLREHFYSGIVAIDFALAVYGARTTLLQIRFRQAQTALQSARDRLEELSLQDGLTGIANRRNFDRTLEAEWHRATRTHQPLSLLLIDLDFFKNVNDEHGHPYGDRCLVEVAHALRSAAARSGDLVARYGGEEFAAILPGTTSEAANTIAERMRQAVLDLQIPNQTELGRFVSVSIGGCTADGVDESTPARLIEAADQTLYKAKQWGRDRTEHTSLQA